VHRSPCYDFIVSLRALYNPRTFGLAGTWRAHVRPKLSPEVRELGKFFFQGFDTGLGYGALRLVPDLGPAAMPADLIDALGKSDARILAAYMLDTGENDAASLDIFRRAMAGKASRPEVESILRGVPPGWAKRCRRVIADPEAAKADLIRLADQYLASAFNAETARVERVIDGGAERAEQLLSVLRTSQAVDQLCGGYTLSEDLVLDRITLAPSAFIYPFMSSRVDEASGTALIVFGVKGAAAGKEAGMIDDSLLATIKALSDGGRLRALSLIRERPMYGPEFVQMLGVTQPTMHHHLSLLRAAGLVRQERTHRGMLYTIRTESAEALIASLGAILLPEAPAQSAGADGRPTRRGSRGKPAAVTPAAAPKGRALPS